MLAASNEDAPRILTTAELLQGVTDPEGNTLTISNLTANRGTLAANANGTWTYTPLANDDTAVVFSYLVSDGIATVSQTATMDLTPVNDVATGAVTFTFAENAGGRVVLTATNTLQDVDGLAGVAYQWQTSTNGTTWTNVTGATASTFTPVAAQPGQAFRVVATATDVNGGTTSVTSAASARLGTAAGQVINGTAGADILAGLGGSDQLNGAGGDDVLFGGAGNDELNGGAGADQLFGGINDDTLNGDAGNDTLNGEAGSDLLNGGAGDDILFGGGRQ